MQPSQAIFCIALFAGGVWLSDSTAFAQNRSTTGSGVSSGYNSLGGSSLSRAGNSFGGGTNPFAPTNANQSVFQNQGSTFGLQNPGQQQSGFIGGSSGQNFLGANQRNQTNNQQQQNQFNNRNNRNRGNQFDLNDFNQQQGLNSQDSRRAIRPQQKVAFDIPTRPATDVHSDVQTKLTFLANNPSFRGIVFDLDAEGVAILTGEVGTASQKRLAENIVRLEPGVKRVRSELKVRDPFADR